MTQVRLKEPLAGFAPTLGEVLATSDALGRYKKFQRYLHVDNDRVALWLQVDILRRESSREIQHLDQKIKTCEKMMQRASSDVKALVSAEMDLHVGCHWQLHQCL